MELTQIHDLIIQLFSLLKKKRDTCLYDGVSAEAKFDWCVQMDRPPWQANSGTASSVPLNWKNTPII